MVDHPVDVAKARVQQGGEQPLGHRQQGAGINMQRAQSIQWPRHGMRGRAIGKGGQGDNRIAQTVQHFGYRQKVHPGGQVLAVIFHHADGQDDGGIRRNCGLQLVRTQAGEVGHGKSRMMSLVCA